MAIDKTTLLSILGGLVGLAWVSPVNGASIVMSTAAHIPTPIHADMDSVNAAPKPATSMAPAPGSSSLPVESRLHTSQGCTESGSFAAAWPSLTQAAAESWQSLGLSSLQQTSVTSEAVGAINPHGRTSIAMSVSI